MSERYQHCRPPICPDRVRRIGHGGFSFVPNRFLHGGYFVSLSHQERSMYLFLVLAGDRNGMSFYSYERICSALEITPEEYLMVRDSLITKDLIAFDGGRYQVLSLPERPVARPSKPLVSQQDLEDHDPATIRSLILESLQESRG